MFRGEHVYTRSRFLLTFDHLQGCKALRGSSVSILLSDVARLVAAYSTPLLSHALHVYHSALTTMPLCPLQRCMPMARRHSDTPLLISQRASGWGPEMKLMYDHKRVTSAALSPDGRYVASGAEDGTIQVRDVALGVQQLAVQGDDNSCVGSIAFSPDGQVIVWGSESSMIHIWDVSAKACRHVISGHDGSVRSVAFSPDGRFVASGSSDSTVRVWDVLTGEQQHIMSGHNRTVLSVAFSPDGHSVVSGSRDHTVRVWNALDGVQRRVIEGHADSVTCAAFSSDGQWIASGSARALRVWDVATGSQHYALDDEIISYVLSVGFSPDSQSVVYMDGSFYVRAWDTSTSTNQARTIWSDYAHVVYAVTSSPTLQVIVGDRKRPAVQVWEIPVEAEGGEQHRALAGHTDAVRSVACSPDGQYIVSGSRDHTIRVWDTTTGAQRHVISGHSAPVFRVAFSSNGEWIVSASWDHTVRVWDAATGAHHRTMEGHADEVYAAAFSADGQFIVSGSDDQTVRLWDATTGHPRHVMSGHDAGVSAVAFSQDGRLVASGSWDKTVRLWDAATGTQHRVMSDHTGTVRTVAFSPDGQFVVSGSDDSTARVWDTTTGAQWRSVDHPSGVLSVEFQPDSRSIMSYCLDDIPARNAATGDPTSLHEQPVQSQIADQQNVTKPLFRHLDDGWIWRQSPQSRSWQRVCWLPSARRGYAYATLSDGQKAFIGGMEGAITILDFSDVKAK
jgi:WD40 repeat protein